MHVPDGTRVVNDPLQRGTATMQQTRPRPHTRNLVSLIPYNLSLCDRPPINSRSPIGPERHSSKILYGMSYSTYISSP